jgi:hypothetical protein
MESENLKLYHVIMPVLELVVALRYHLEGCGFDSQWYLWNLSLT